MHSAWLQRPKAPGASPRYARIWQIFHYQKMVYVKASASQRLQSGSNVCTTTNVWNTFSMWTSEGSIIPAVPNQRGGSIISCCMDGASFWTQKGKLSCLPLDVVLPIEVYIGKDQGHCPQWCHQWEPTVQACLIHNWRCRPAWSLWPKVNVPGSQPQWSQHGGGHHAHCDRWHS